MSLHQEDVTCSVCIANYNGEAILPACLESVFAQQLPGSFEVIVHDDASTDASLLVLANYPSVRVLRSDTNVGFCESNNRMVAASRGHFVLLLNNDAALDVGALAALLREAEAGAAPAILSLPQRDWHTGQLVDRGCLLDAFMNPVPNIHADRRAVAMVIGACLWMPRALWNTVGGFPEWIESIAEDMYVCCAARQRGYAVRCLTAPGYRHMQGYSFGGNRADEGRLVSTYRRRRLSERNKTFLLIIFTPSPWLVPALLLHAAVLLCEGMLVSLLRQDRKLWKDIYVNALTSAWRDRRSLSERRTRVQVARTVSAREYYSAFTWTPRKLAMLLRFGLPRVQQ